jgi:simple sugar transport system permease protein
MQRKTKATRFGGRKDALYRSLLPVAALALLVVFNLIFTKNFSSITLKDGRLFGAMIDILYRSSPVILIALGMTLVMATRGIDLSVGAVMALSGATAAILLTTSGLSVPLVILAGLAVATAAGLWNGILVTYLQIQPIVATLILMVAGRGIAQLWTDGRIITFESKSFEFISSGTVLWLPATVFIAVGAYVIAQFLAKKTVLGTYIEAVGGNETATSYAGINVNAVKLFVYAFSGLCAGMAGLIATADIKAADLSNIGLNSELDAILAAVIGGTLFSGGKFNLTGAVFGALIMQTLTTQIYMNGLDKAYTLVIKAAIVIVVCLMQSPALKEMLSKTKRRSSPK